MQSDQAFQDAGHFQQRAGTHALGVFLEAVFPVAVASVFADGKGVQDLLDFAVANHTAQANAAGVLAGYHYFEAAGFDVEEVEPLNGRADGAAADLFNHPNAVIGIHNLVADVEIQIRTAHVRHPERRSVRGEKRSKGLRVWYSPDLSKARRRLGSGSIRFPQPS